MTKTLTLQTHNSYIKRALKSTPQNALYEMIWNACDADAKNINVSFQRNEMDNVIACIIKDDGIGIDQLSLEKSFGYLGLSDKQYKLRSDSGRIYHGKLGQGRYNAVSVSRHVDWETIYSRDNKFYQYTIQIFSEDEKQIIVSEEKELNNVSDTGTTVKIEFQEKKGKVFNDLDNTIKELIIHFAPYLKSYPIINITIDGNSVNVDEYIQDINKCQLDFVANNQDLSINLIIIKWNEIKSKGQLYFCDSTGTTIETGPALSYKGTDAYLCSHYFGEAEIAPLLKSYRLDGVLNNIVEIAVTKINDFIKSIQDEELLKEIELLKQKKIYPYIEKPKTDMEKAEQTQFDILALEINKIVPQLKNSTQTIKKLIYMLLKETVKTTPDSFTEILNNIIALNDEQKDSLAKLLKTTSLPAIIKTSQLLINRNKFLDALYLMVYDDNVEKSIKERTQFQKILLDNLWLFGEDYTYGVDDVSVRNLLKKYVSHLGRTELAPNIPDDGAYNLDRIPDICLFNKYPLGENQYKNLVIEIKKPKKVLGKDEYDQIIDYHDIITQSAAFPGITTKWHFILIGKDTNDYVKKRIKEHEDVFGLGNIIKDNNSKVSILTWGEIIQRNKAKIEYLTRALEIQVGEESDILQYLHDNYGKYLNDLY